MGGWWSVWAPGLRSINHVWGTREGRGAPWVLFPRLAWNAQNHFQASCLPSLPPAGRCSGRCYSLHVPVATGPATTNHPMRPPGQGVAEGSHGSVQASASHPGVPFGTEPADLSMFLPNPPFLPCPNISLKRGPYPSQGSCSQPPTLPTLTPGLQGGALGRKTNTFSCRREQQSGCHSNKKSRDPRLGGPGRPWVGEPGGNAWEWVLGAALPLFWPPSFLSPTRVAHHCLGKPPLNGVCGPCNPGWVASHTASAWIQSPCLQPRATPTFWVRILPGPRLTNMGIKRSDG